MFGGGGEEAVSVGSMVSGSSFIVCLELYPLGRLLSIGWRAADTATTAPADAHLLLLLLFLVSDFLGFDLSWIGYTAGGLNEFTFLLKFRQKKLIQSIKDSLKTAYICYERLQSSD